MVKITQKLIYTSSESRKKFAEQLQSKHYSWIIPARYKNEYFYISLIIQCDPENLITYVRTILRRMFWNYYRTFDHIAYLYMVIRWENINIEVILIFS